MSVILWEDSCGEVWLVSENLRIQYLAVDPFNCVQAIFETELIMNNDVILLGIIILSFVINVGIWLAIVKAVQK